MKDYYEILGISKEATQDEIKRSYRELAKKWHPDRNPDNREEAETKFKEISEAYEVLHDPDKRRRYDSGGLSESDININFNDIFSTFGDIFGESWFGGGFHSTWGGGLKQKKGANRRLRVTLGLEEIVKGCTKRFNVKKEVSCPHCSGTGSSSGNAQVCPKCKGSGHIIVTNRSSFGIIQRQITCPECNGSGNNIKDPCKVCRGTGIVSGEEEIEISFPPGLFEGVTLNIPGKGDAAPNNGIPGDLQVLIEEDTYPSGFSREGQNLYYDFPISYPDAVLGTSAEVPIVGGVVKISIPPGTQPGSLLRLRGKGIPSLNNQNDVGDELVKIEVKVPTKVSEEEKELLQKLKDLTSDE